MSNPALIITLGMNGAIGGANSVATNPDGSYDVAGQVLGIAQPVNTAAGLAGEITSLGSATTGVLKSVTTGLGVPLSVSGFIYYSNKIVKSESGKVAESDVAGLVANSAGLLASLCAAASAGAAATPEAVAAVPVSGGYSLLLIPLVMVGTIAGVHQYTAAQNGWIVNTNGVSEVNDIDSLLPPEYESLTSGLQISDAIYPSQPPEPSNSEPSIDEFTSGYQLSQAMHSSDPAAADPYIQNLLDTMHDGEVDTSAFEAFTSGYQLAQEINPSEPTPMDPFIENLLNTMHDGQVDTQAFEEFTNGYALAKAINSSDPPPLDPFVQKILDNQLANEVDTGEYDEFTSGYGLAKSIHKKEEVETTEEEINYEESTSNPQMLLVEQFAVADGYDSEIRRRPA